MIFDTHLHTNASPDGKMTPEAAIVTLQKKGLGGIFTEHVDYDTKGKMVFSADLSRYPGEYLKYKSDTVLLGLEINLIAECVEQNRLLASLPNLDYIIGSVHYTDGFDIGFDGLRADDYFKKYGTDFYKRHLAYMVEVVEVSDFFDAFGHIDYISRYSTLSEKNVLYDDFSDLYDQLLSILVKRDIPIELSTRRLKEKGALSNLFKIYKRYRDLGGRYVTIGSDAHKAERIGNDFGIAYDMVNEVGLVPVYFKERRMIECISG